VQTYPLGNHGSGAFWPQLPYTFTAGDEDQVEVDVSIVNDHDPNDAASKAVSALDTISDYAEKYVQTAYPLGPVWPAVNSAIQTVNSWFAGGCDGAVAADTVLGTGATLRDWTAGGVYYTGVDRHDGTNSLWYCGATSLYFTQYSITATRSRPDPNPRRTMIRAAPITTSTACDGDSARGDADRLRFRTTCARTGDGVMLAPVFNIDSPNNGVSTLEIELARELLCRLPARSSFTSDHLASVDVMRARMRAASYRKRTGLVQRNVDWIRMRALLERYPLPEPRIANIRTGRHCDER
jgi:hypothetical protein